MFFFKHSFRFNCFNMIFFEENHRGRMTFNARSFVVGERHPPWNCRNSVGALDWQPRLKRVRCGVHGGVLDGVSRGMQVELNP